MLPTKSLPRPLAPDVSVSSSRRAESRIYMDCNGSMPLLPAAREAMLPFLAEPPGNPSSGHWAAMPAAAAVEAARRDVAKLIGAEPHEIVFTSGATEANNVAIKGTMPARPPLGHVVTVATEHVAVLNPVRHLKSRGVRVTVLGVDRRGRVDPDAVGAAISEDTTLITIMAANNETGVIQPIAEIGRIAKAVGVTFHCDAAQVIGKMPVDVGRMGVDLMSLAAHKFGGPTGIGALYVRNGVRLTPLLHGAGQERGRRAGTESAMLAAGMGAAASSAASRDLAAIAALRDHFWLRLQQMFGDRVVLNGHPELRVPNTLSVGFPGHIGAEILARMPEVAATTGSACHAGCIDMSHVLLAMGTSTEVGLGTIRFSLGEHNTRDEVEEVVGRLGAILG